ncbi:hypothetical protein B0H19DRAFT_953194 [Mycena capillaripes]|nr:hypothetical protein B0H19DRAFT_953194 [Mycena capillaripes]
MGDKLRVFWLSFGFFGSYIRRLVYLQYSALRQRWTYKLTPDAKNVVVVGGSFAGIDLVKGLAATLPTGFKVLWVEKNSHFNYSYNFPRFSVVPGYEHTAFIPYDGIAKGAPAGLLTRVQDTVVGLTDTQVLLASGPKLDYEYLVIATGSSQPLPVQVSSTEFRPACRELQSVQEAIKDSQKIAVVGAGAVGVELATDIKGFYPEKDVTLVHSRNQLLNNFGKRLHEYVLPFIRDELKIRVLLNERPQLPKDRALLKGKTLAFSDEHEESFDLVIGCTGQRPNSSFVASFSPDSVSKKTSRILVKPTLQISSASPRIFAFGDVAEHGGPQMARAGLMQSRTVLDNIIAMIYDRPPSAIYTPQLILEGALKLTLGKERVVIYTQEDRDAEKDILIPAQNRAVDLGIARAWKMFGADFKRARAAKELLAEPK